MMKKIILPLLLACCAPLNAADDCAKNADACSAGQKAAVSPFLAASAQPVKKAAAAAPAKKPAPAVQPAPQAAVEAPPAAAPVQAPSGAPASSPLWLLLVGAGLSGLYFYLGGRSRKGKKR